jgi:hypothetical protein
MIEFLQTHLVLLLSLGLGVSELLALIPAVKSNSIFQLVVNSLKAMLEKKQSEGLK